MRSRAANYDVLVAASTGSARPAGLGQSMLAAAKLMIAVTVNWAASGV
ncbi:MAG: hypothetical protein HC838_01415 [Spirulinaceae cyanobacterium RM2_2_10]|nr:hypothetical protein [Spirulinaceae cyanobacterium SM2_1_0]NJO18987.1 hypothetical protein [Spirulinaceae cyanobacterium RM2_2_10]